MLMLEEDLSPQDVIAYRDDPVFSHKARTFAALAVDCVPGTLLTSEGEAYTSGSDILIALDSHKAGANVPVIVVDRGCILKRNGLRAATPAALTAAITAIETSGLNRVSE
ncbi:hypothetical protein [Pantoea vagans]|uniref:hypothetical protein n=1 Tax=Pantoea vagans TaxID=470934 RepID=UPI003AFD0FE3|nr:hypothetical protein [Klebsiella oxytoca]HCI5764087.1 hypothetical protein [Klebsiella quasipneumoniae subsp. quasipneumoniae]